MVADTVVSEDMVEDRADEVEDMEVEVALEDLLHEDIAEVHHLLPKVDIADDLENHLSEDIAEVRVQVDLEVDMLEEDRVLEEADILVDHHVMVDLEEDIAEVRVHEEDIVEVLVEVRVVATRKMLHHEDRAADIATTEIAMDDQHQLNNKKEA